MKLNATKSRWYTLVLGGFLCLGLLSAGYAASNVNAMKEVKSPPRSGGVGSAMTQDRTGGPLSSGDCSGCHAGGSFNTIISVDVRDIGNNVVTSYIPGAQYTIEYLVEETGFSSANGFGMQSVILDASNNGVGSYGTINTTNSQVSVVNGRNYFEHSGASVSGFFSIDWTAPTAGTGTVSIYGMGLAINANGATSGDDPSSPLSMSLTENIPTTIDFPGNPYCSNVANPTPVVAGEQGGTYSAPIGLDINASTGVINMAGSTPGTYTVTYTGATETATFDVTINPTVTSSDAATICANETLAFGGQTLTSANAGLNTEVFQAVNGCDSTVELTLTVLPTPTEQLAESICANETLNFNGQILDASNAGLNTFTTTSSGGCDSTIELTLSVLPLDTVQISETICQNDTYDFNGQILDENDAGLHTATLSGTNGCDSIVELTLSVTQIDLSVAINGFGEITAVQQNATYQWVDCNNNNTALPGETNQTLTPPSPGSYAAEITVGNCTELSDCADIIANLNELNPNSLNVYPSPAKDILRIKNLSELTDVEFMEIINISGQQMWTNDAALDQIDITILTSGTYFLKVQHTKGLEIVKFVKQ